MFLLNPELNPDHHFLPKALQAACFEQGRCLLTVFYRPCRYILLLRISTHERSDQLSFKFITAIYVESEQVSGINKPAIEQAAHIVEIISRSV